MYLVSLIYHAVCSCDLDLDPITLIYKLNLGTLKLWKHSKIKSLGQGFQKVTARTGWRDRQAHRQTRPNALPQVVKN